ncbi:hypothetical protein TcWFU_005536 [Taenia crassiceps]|uniref:Uncharacterized protein n=1 Tax=Taenia crassiceps TaxID=6207 RepID=A0ABR4QBD3_9CEST
MDRAGHCGGTGHGLWSGGAPRRSDDFEAPTVQPSLLMIPLRPAYLSGLLLSLQLQCYSYCIPPSFCDSCACLSLLVSLCNSLTMSFLPSVTALCLSLSATLSILPAGFITVDNGEGDN